MQDVFSSMHPTRPTWLSGTVPPSLPHAAAPPSGQGTGLAGQPLSWAPSLSLAASKRQPSLAWRHGKKKLPLWIRRSAIRFLTPLVCLSVEWFFYIDTYEVNSTWHREQLSARRAGLDLLV